MTQEYILFQNNQELKLNKLMRYTIGHLQYFRLKLTE